jgi:hypothetical protein
MALSILRPLMYFLILQLVLQKRLVPFSPVVSEMFNCEILEDNGCQVAAIPHMTVTTFIRVVYLICITQLNDSFQGVGEPPKERGTSRCMTTLNEEYKGRVTFCSHLASVV